MQQNDKYIENVIDEEITTVGSVSGGMEPAPETPPVTLKQASKYKKKNKDSLARLRQTAKYSQQ